jgi:hypothetical protein
MKCLSSLLSSLSQRSQPRDKWMMVAHFLSPRRLVSACVSAESIERCALLMARPLFFSVTSVRTRDRWRKMNEVGDVV